MLSGTGCGFWWLWGLLTPLDFICVVRFVAFVFGLMLGVVCLDYGVWLRDFLVGMRYGCFVACSVWCDLCVRVLFGLFGLGVLV